MMRLWLYIQNNPYVLMIVGMVLLLSGVFLMIEARNSGGSKQLAATLGIAGVVVYLIGRIGIMLQRRAKSSKSNSSQQSTPTEQSLEDL
ncbi:MAG: hypothetical protein JW795_17140 [Chitinivibrionales bacterium]|nr:hypothetical protein [Chitinivibrionales bacterium]